MDTKIYTGKFWEPHSCNFYNCFQTFQLIFSLRKKSQYKNKRLYTERMLNMRDPFQAEKVKI